MAVKQRRYEREEFARRGDEIYERDIRAQVKPGHNEEIVAIDIETGQWEVDPDESAAANRLDARVSDSQIYVRRVGPSRSVRTFGARIDRAMP